MTERRAYSVYVIPAAHQRAINVALAIVNGDDPVASTACSVAANASGSHEDPISHYYGGMPTTQAWEALVGNLGAEMVAANWPVTGVGGEVTEAEAIAAAEQLHLQITVTQDGSQPSPQTTLGNALSALSLQQVEWPD